MMNLYINIILEFGLNFYINMNDDIILSEVMIQKAILKEEILIF